MTLKVDIVSGPSGVFLYFRSNLKKESTMCSSNGTIQIGDKLWQCADIIEMMVGGHSFIYDNFGDHYPIPHDEFTNKLLHSIIREGLSSLPYPIFEVEIEWNQNHSFHECVLHYMDEEGDWRTLSGEVFVYQDHYQKELANLQVHFLLEAEKTLQIHEVADRLLP